MVPSLDLQMSNLKTESQIGTVDENFFSDLSMITNYVSINLKIPCDIKIKKI